MDIHIFVNSIHPSHDIGHFIHYIYILPFDCYEWDNNHKNIRLLYKYQNMLKFYFDNLKFNKSKGNYIPRLILQYLKSDDFLLQSISDQVNGLINDHKKMLKTMKKIKKLLGLKI